MYGEKIKFMVFTILENALNLFIVTHVPVLYSLLLMYQFSTQFSAPNSQRNFPPQVFYTFE